MLHIRRNGNRISCLQGDGFIIKNELHFADQHVEDFSHDFVMMPLQMKTWFQAIFYHAELPIGLFRRKLNKAMILGVVVIVSFSLSN